MTDRTGPRPWRVKRPYYGESSVVAKNNRVIYWCYPYDDMENDNAELIVRAVNSHDALVEACESLVKRMTIRHWHLCPLCGGDIIDDVGYEHTEQCPFVLASTALKEDK